MRCLILVWLLCLFLSLCQCAKLPDRLLRAPVAVGRDKTDQLDTPLPKSLEIRDGWDKWSSASIPGSSTTVLKCDTITLTVTNTAATVVTTAITVTTTVSDTGSKTTVTALAESQKDVTTVLLISTTTVATVTVTTTETGGIVTVTTPGPGEKASTTITRVKYDATHITLIQVVNTALPPGPPVFNICAANSSTINYGNSSSSNVTTNNDNRSQKDQAYNDVIVAYRMTTPWWAILLIVLLILFGLLILAALAMLLLGKKHSGQTGCVAVPPGTCGSCGEICTSCVCGKPGSPLPPVCVADDSAIRHRKSWSGYSTSSVLSICEKCGQRHERGLCSQLGLLRIFAGATGHRARMGELRHESKSIAEIEQARESMEVRAAVHSGGTHYESEMEEIRTTQTSEMHQFHESAEYRSDEVVTHENANVHIGTEQARQSRLSSEGGQISSTEDMYDGARTPQNGGGYLNRSEHLSYTEQLHGNGPASQSDNAVNETDHGSMSLISSHDKTIATTEEALGFVQAFESGSFHGGTSHAYNSDIFRHGEAMLASGWSRKGMRESGGSQLSVGGDRYMVGKEVFERRSYGGNRFSTSQFGDTAYEQTSRNHLSKKASTHISVAEISDEERDDSDSSYIAPREVVKNSSEANTLRNRIHVAD